MKMDTVLREISTNPNLQTSATAPNPLFTIIPPYGNIEAQYDTFMAQVRLTGDPVRWLGYNLSYRKFELDGQDRRLHLHEHGPRRRGRLVQRRRLHPRARGLGHREREAPWRTSPRSAACGSA